MLLGIRSDWLQKYIDFNTGKRKKMQIIVLKKTFFKLMNNSIYGKTMENLSQRISISFVNNTKDYKDYKNM